MKKILTSIITGFLFFFSVQAQIIEGGAGFIKLGKAIVPNSDNIFLQIAPDKISGFTSDFMLIGAEVYYRKSKSIFTLEGNLETQKPYHSATTYAEPYSGAAHLSFGRILAGNKKFWIYPAVGGGISFITLMTYNKTDGTAKNIEYQTLRGPSLNLGINGDFLLSRFHLIEKFYLGSMLGVRVGYRTSFRNNSWKTVEIKDTRNMPSYTNNAYYLTITFGGGSFDLK